MNIHTGTVIAVHPATQTCDVLLDMGGFRANVPVLGVIGGPQSGDMAWSGNLRGAPVALIPIRNRLHILATLPIQAVPRETVALSPSDTGTGGDNGSTYGRPRFTDYGGARPGGFLPGDKILRADGGAELLLGMEGLAMLQASPLAGLILGALGDFARLVAREISLFTDFGEVTFSHGGSGRTGMTLLGGADYGTEAAPGVSKWTVRLWLGDVPGQPDKRLKLRISSADDAEWVTCLMGADGKLDVSTSKDCTRTVGRDDTETVSGQRDTTVMGKDTLRCGGKRNTVVASDEAHAVAGNYNVQVGGSLTVGAASLNLTSLGGAGGNCTVRCSSLNIVKG